MDRKCYVVLSLGLVVTRLGAPTGTNPTLDLSGTTISGSC